MKVNFIDPHTTRHYLELKRKLLYTVLEYTRVFTPTDRGCSAVVIAFRLIPKVLGSNPTFSAKHVTCLIMIIE